MDPMQRPTADSGDPLDSLLKEYREACPDSEPGAHFMPQMWGRIEARRNSSIWVRRYAEICVAATLVLALLLTIFVIPRFQEFAYDSYVDVLAAADSVRDATLLPASELGALESGELE